ncbi:hypothetical protein LCGC14_1140750, partial [marine sediment metagenome]
GHVSFIALAPQGLSGLASWPPFEYENHHYQSRAGV